MPFGHKGSSPVSTIFYIKNFYLFSKVLDTCWPLILSLVLLFRICFSSSLLAHLTPHPSWTWHMWATSGLYLSSEQWPQVVPLCPTLHLGLQPPPLPPS